MNIQEEKKHIYEMMRDITAERRKLTDIYYGLKERLDWLHNVEQKGLEDLSIKGYVDLYNNTMKEVAVANLKREVEHQIEKIENHNIIEEKENTVIPKEEVQRAVEKENIRTRRGRISSERVEGTALTVLKDAGAPLKLSEWMNRISAVLDTKISASSFQTRIIPSLLEKNDKIDKPMRGFYQYKL